MTDPATGPVAEPAADPAADSAIALEGAAQSEHPKSAAEIERVVDTALPMFAANGFSGTKLDAVAKQSGVSKRMLHYYFGDKLGLYERVLGRASELLKPPQEVLDRSYAVPVEGMRRFVDSMFHVCAEHADCARLLMRERLNPSAGAGELGARAHSEVASDVALQAERLLILGQDAGAFRPGISADDLLALIAALCEFQVSHPEAFYAANRIDFANHRNVEGMRRLVIDAVLAFLTSNIPHSGYESYLVGSRNARAKRMGVTTAEQVYDIGGAEYF